ncbi:MAG: GNAT family N-acetyltransferase [Oscillospiraceae bacterium]|nr:GNAT family N-acetyltransferase [Oscillospiraceae bacterium]
MMAVIREIKSFEYPLLEDFLYEAIFIPDGIEPPPKSIVQEPELQIYVSHFGEKKDDRALVAEVDGKVVGAVWARMMPDYGHIDDETPSLAISLYKAYRGLGIGTALLQVMLSFLKESGYTRTSLSVQKANHAVKLYQKVGYKVVEENDEEYIMVKYL